jgi:hypothetical protein
MSLADASIVGGLVVLVVMHLRQRLVTPPHLGPDSLHSRRAAASPPVGTQFQADRRGDPGAHVRRIRGPYDWSREA